MKRNNAKDFWVPISGLILAMLLWGSSFIAMKVALTTYDPLLVILGRMLIAASIFLVFRRWFGKIMYRPGDWKLLGLMALCEPCLYFTFEVYALNFTSASEAATITALLPLMTALAARLILSEKISLKSLAGFLVAFCGVVALTVAGKPTESAPHPALGNTLEFLAMVCAAGYTVASRHLSLRYSAFFLTAMQTFVGSVFFMPALFLPSTRIPVEFDLHTSLAIVYLGAVVSVVAYFLYNYGLSRIPASQVSPYVNLIPVFSILLSWFLLGEQLTRMQYFAAILVLAGTFFCRERWTVKSEQ